MYKITVDYKDGKPQLIVEMNTNYDEAYQKMAQLNTPDVKVIAIREV